ncbi:MAG: hypothetical protein Q4E55_03425 [Bacteroidales bacterium]|nr:hypothetical protein [Bacteroidales bacterium]
MNELSIWYASLDPMLRFYWWIAGISTIVFVVQSILTFIGIDATDTDADFDVDNTLDMGGGLNLFSVKNVVALLMGIGWGGICFYPLVGSHLFAGFLSVVTGSLFVALFVFIFRQTRKLERNGAWSLADCVGLVADVYLHIPPQGKGQIQVSVHGSIHELTAVSDGVDIPTGRKVRIEAVIDESTVKVSTI